jgi:Ras-related GTP-binding protein A/B
VDRYLTPDAASTLFPFTAALIYVFEVRKLNNAGQPLPESVTTFRRILDVLLQYSPEARIFILIHKMDLLNNDERPILFKTWVETVKETCQKTPVVIFASSIYEDSLFRVRDFHRASLTFTNASLLGLVHNCTNASSQPRRN